MMYHGRTLTISSRLPALAAIALLTGSTAVFPSFAAALTTIKANTKSAASSSSSSAPSGPGATVTINYPNGFAGVSKSIINMGSSAAFQGSAIALTSGNSGEHEAGSAFDTTLQNIQSFSTDFTFKLNPSSFGITFCVQNSTAATNPLAWGAGASADTNLLGYGAYNPQQLGSQYSIHNSIAVAFSINNFGETNYPSGGAANATGLYLNGGPYAALVPINDLNPYGVNLHSGDIMAGHIVYDGTLLTMTVKDTVTGAQARYTWPVNIPAVTLGNSAYVGFTGGTIPAVSSDLLSWTFSQGYAPRLPTPTFSLAGGSYPSAQNVTLTGYPGATIYYTTNGLQPTSSSTVYTGPISVSSSEVIQAVAIETGYEDSLVAAANYQIAPAGSPLINFTNGIPSNLVTVNGSAQLNGSAIQLTDTVNYLEAGSAWYAVPVNVQSFTTNFTLQLRNPTANGMTFTIQNSPPASSDTSITYVSGGPTALGNNQNGLGYSGSTGSVGGQIAGLLSSVAIKFDLYDGSGNTTGLYTNGADVSTGGIDMTSSGFSLHSGNPLNVTLAYDGATLAMTITDTKTKATFSNRWTIDIPGTVGGSTAYVGFTGGTGGGTANQQITSWTYAVASAQTPPVPAAPTNLRVQ